jgi:AraC-like DNA-binding protein
MTRLTFTDYDAFAEAVRDVSVTFRPSAMEVPRWTLQYETVGPISVQQGFEGGGTIAEGATRSDGWTFFQQSHPGHANGQVLSPLEVLAAPPGNEFCLTCKPSHEWISVFIPDSLLFPTTPALAFAPRARPQLLKPPPQVIRRFTSLVHRFLSTTESRPQVLDCPAAVESYGDQLVSAARELFARSGHSESRHFLRWHRLTKSTSALAMSRPDQSLSISELARQVGVPERTLRTAFQKSFGLSPQEYLRIQRLYQARRLLRASCQDQTSVTQVAFALGFWDVGRFAGAYRTLFGERPSETLRHPVRVSIGVPHH